jgi:tyrosyl-tRNA synthetase
VVFGAGTMWSNAPAHTHRQQIHYLFLHRASCHCRFVHGEEGLTQALKATEALRPGAATALDATTLEAIAGDAPSCSLAASQCTNAPLVDVMVASGMLKSKGEVRGRIQAGMRLLQSCCDAPGCCRVISQLAQ